MLQPGDVMDGIEGGSGFRPTRRDAWRRLELSHMVDPVKFTAEETTKETHTIVQAREWQGDRE